MTPPAPTTIAPLARWLWAGMTALLLFSHPSAQAAQEERWLLVFDTSSVMKKLLPATESALNGFLASNGGGQIHAGDSVGVWAFDQQLRSGQFPLIHWPPANAGAAASNLVTFIRRQRYTGKTSFAALQSPLGEVISNSERLTVVIFCDGQDDVQWTPYADGINRTFRQNLEERKNSRQPFVLLLRTQQGKYTGCTVNFPPGGLTIPSFPPLPLPPPPPEATNNRPPLPLPPAPKPLPPVVPSLVIVGTTIGTNLADMPPPVGSHPQKIDAATNLIKPTNFPALQPEPVKSSISNTEPIVKPAPLPSPEPGKSPESNPVVAAKSAPKPAPAPLVTNAPETKVEPPAKATAPTNRVASTVAAADASNGQERGWLPLTGAWLIGVLGLLVFLVVRFRRRDHVSLITASMDKDRPPPGGN